MKCSNMYIIHTSVMRSVVFKNTSRVGTTSWNNLGRLLFLTISASLIIVSIFSILYPRANPSSDSKRLWQSYQCAPQPNPWNSNQPHRRDRLPYLLPGWQTYLLVCCDQCFSRLQFWHRAYPFFNHPNLWLCWTDQYHLRLRKTHVSPRTSPSRLTWDLHMPGSRSRLHSPPTRSLRPVRSRAKMAITSTQNLSKGATSITASQSLPLEYTYERSVVGDDRHPTA